MKSTSILDSFQALGQYSFITQSFQNELKISNVAVSARLRRLRQQGHIATPYPSFHVIVFPKYRHLKCIPPELFIDDLMRHLNKPYYVSLLTSARYYGAAHQIPMAFQVMVAEQQPNIRCGQVFIQFVTHSKMQLLSDRSKNSEAGVFQIATPETTLLQMVGYPEHCGYWNNVLMVFDELADQIDIESLKGLFTHIPTTWLQRLGYLSVFIEQDEIAEAVEEYLRNRVMYPISLASWLPKEGRMEHRWKVSINVELEMDL